MPVPTYDQFIEPLLRHLASKPEGSSITDAYAAVAKATRLTEADLAELLPSGGQAVFRNRIGWAHDRLKRNGYSASPRRGFWKLTSQGVAFAAKSKALSPDQVEHIANVDRSSRLKPGSGSAPAVENTFAIGCVSVGWYLQS